MIRLEKTLPGWGEIAANSEEERLLLNGVIAPEIKAQLLQGFRDLMENGPGVKVVSRRDGHLLALLDRQAEGFCKIRRVFPREN